jgi:hypothetical protein
MRQIGLAMHMHHDIYGQLPAGWSALHPVNGAPYWLGRPGWAWGAAILPYLEQENIIDSLIDFDVPITDTRHEAVRVTSLSTYRCPSDIAKNTFLLEPGPMPMPNYDTQFTTTELATGNYVGVFGTVPMKMVCGNNGNCRGDGCLVFQAQFRFGDLYDGLSQTLLVWERRSLTYPSTWLGVLAGGHHAPGRVVGVASFPPNSREGDMMNFSSFHSKGTNFVSADGAVNFISQTIDRSCYLALCTRAGRDKTGDSHVK